MKLIFAGTPEFAACTLSALLASRHSVQLVLTLPDRAGGRGLRLQPSPVKTLALGHGIALLQPPTLKATPLQDALRAAGADAMVVAAYGLILPQAMLEIPRLGALNIHASLLPRWRGAAPIQRAILAGDRETGISIMQMDAGLDTGPVLASEATPIRDEDTAQTLHDRLAQIGAKMIVAALDALERGALQARPQSAVGACYAAKVDKSEARVDWTAPASIIARQVRAFHPVPLANCRFRGAEVKLWLASPEPGRAAAGEVVEASPAGILVGCGEGALRVLELQRAGGRRMRAAEFLHGMRLQPGERFQ